jgi:hypothetical protein
MLLIVGRVLLVVVAAAATAVILHRHSPSTENGSTDSKGAPYGGIGAAPLGDPYGIGGGKTTLSTAVSEATFSVVVPDPDMKETANLTGVWHADYGEDDSQVVLQYDDGALWIEENPLADPDPDAVLMRYQDDMKKMNGWIGRDVFSIEYLRSTPVLVAQPGADANGSNPAAVEVAINGADVVLYSHVYPPDRLAGVADSLLASRTQGASRG